MEVQGRRKRRSRGKNRPRRVAEVKPLSTLPLPYLPEDIIQQIFNKLPLKSLACCKLTCKTWNSLISDSQFMHDTFKRVLGGNNYHLIFLESRTLKFYMRTFTYHHLINNNEAVIRQTHNPPSKLISQSILIGSCNGLVALLYDYRRYILWNPLTGNYSTMFGDRSHYLEDLEDLKVGLCYDAYSDEYTTVVAYDQFVEVVNFKDGTCSSNYSPNLLAEGVGKMVCGVPHWMNTKTSEKGIIYFDLKDKKFKGIEWPNRANTNELFGLAAMDGQRQLGIVLCHIPSSSLEIWVMEKYMDFESWTKLLIIPYQNSVASIGLSDMDVLGCMPTTEILINTRFEGLWACDLQQGSLKRIYLKPTPHYYVITTFEPSLTSLPPIPKKKGEKKKKKNKRNKRKKN